MHWRSGEFPHTGHTWLARMKSGDFYVFRVTDSDDLGGNLVDLSLAGLRWKDMTEEKFHFDFYHDRDYAIQNHGIESWVRIETMNSEEWKRFVAYCKRTPRPSIAWKRMCSYLNRPVNGPIPGEEEIQTMSPEEIRDFVKSVCHSESVLVRCTSGCPSCCK